MRSGTRAWVSLLAATALACGEEVKTAVVVAPPVMVEEVKLRTVVDRIEATGELIARAEASIAAQVDGQITEIHVDEGERVEAGAVLIEIDPERRLLEVTSQQAAVAEQAAQLAEAQREARRLRNLREKGAVSQSQVDGAETALQLARAQAEAARARLGLAQRALADSSIKAPFAGTLAKRWVNAGEFVSVGQALFDLVSLDEIEVEFHLSERDSGRARKGANVAVRVAPHPDRTFPATVTMVSPTIDARSRTLRVKAAVADPDGLLKPGLFARADLGLRERDGVVTIPEEAVMLRADGTIVFKLEPDDRVSRVRVETGAHEAGWIEIVEGLSKGDRVVVRGQTRLVDGSVVQVRTADGVVASAAAGSER